MPRKGPSTIRERINRVQGQLDGVAKMIDSRESNEKVMIQLKAVISSLESVKVQLIKRQMKSKIQDSLDEIADMLR